MIDGAVRSKIGAIAFLHVGYAKSESLAHELVGALEVRRGKHHMLYCFRTCPLAPFTMSIQSVDRAGRVENVRRAHDGPLVIHAQRKRQSAIRQEMRRAIAV